MIAAQCAPFVLRESHTLNVLQSRIHGLDHWWRVWKNAVLISSGDHSVDMEVVALFTLFHDSMRLNDQDDPAHGMRGFRLWEQYKARDTHIETLFSQRQEELFFEAVVEHSNGQITTNPTIAVCWDADRLDLFRAGIFPDPRFMSTNEARALCPNKITR
jgi:uncharacterized protein